MSSAAKNADDTGNFPRCFDTNGRDIRMRHVTAEKGDMQHPGRSHIACVPASTAQELRILAAAHACADQLVGAHVHRRSAIPRDRLLGSFGWLWTMMTSSAHRLCRADIAAQRRRHLRETCSRYQHDQHHQPGQHRQKLDREIHLTAETEPQGVGEPDRQGGKNGPADAPTAQNDYGDSDEPSSSGNPRAERAQRTDGQRRAAEARQGAACQGRLGSDPAHRDPLESATSGSCPHAVTDSPKRVRCIHTHTRRQSATMP